LSFTDAPTSSDYAHRLNPGTPVEETMRTMVQLKKYEYFYTLTRQFQLTNAREGKIKHIGLCEVGSDSLRRACKIGQVAAVQVEYSPFELTIEKETSGNLLQTCRELGVAVVCSSPLGRGLLTGTLTSRESISGAGDMRANEFPRFSEEHHEANFKLVSQFKSFADKKGCTSSQLAISWLLKQGNDIIPIPGTKQIKYLEQNWDTLKFPLTDEEEAEIRKFLESIDVQGYKSSEAAKAIDYAVTKEDA
jgi:aryl-alcohol dehydrogenase-like predicted oxidoreductase